MSISRRVARPLLASMFINGGIDAIRNPDDKVKAAEAVTAPASDIVPFLPRDTATLVKFNGAVQVGAGLLLALGKFRRLAAWALIGSVVPTTYAGHRFWEESDGEARKQQKVHFLKNLGLLGGLILAAFDTEGAPSLGWMVHRRAREVSQAVGSRHAAAESNAHRISAEAARTGNKAYRKANRTASRAAHRADQAMIEAARAGIAHATPYADRLSETVQSVQAAVLGAAPAIPAGLERAGELVSRAVGHLSE